MPEDVVYVFAGVISLLIIGLIMEVVPDSFAKQSLGGGTVQALLAVAAGVPISFRCAMLRVAVSAIYFVGGGTLGGDGPTIQVCTAMAGMIGWVCGIRSPRTQSLLASLGFCCGFAATFNAPLAGILFAMEELQHVSSRLTTRVIIIILVGSVVSTSVMRGFLGNRVLFQVAFHPGLSGLVSSASFNQVFGENLWMLIAVPIGLMSAIVGYMFHKIFHFLHWFLQQYGFRFCSRYIVFATVAGFSAAIGSIVFRLTGVRGVWGIGVQSLSQALNQNEELQDNDALIVAIGKLAAFSLCAAARFPGDTLEPVLISGGFLGAWVGRWLPMAGQEGRSACEIFGMVGLFASCFRFPLTPILIVLELTGTDSYFLILPVALSSFTALFISNHLFPPILEQILAQDGIDLEAIAELAEMVDDEEKNIHAEMAFLDRSSASESDLKMGQSHSSILSAESIRSIGAPSALQAVTQAFGKLEESMVEVSSVDHRTRRLSRGSMASSRRSDGVGPFVKPTSIGCSCSEASQNSVRSMPSRDGTRRISFQEGTKDAKEATCGQSSPRPGPTSGRQRSSRGSRGSACSSQSAGGAFCSSKGSSTEHIPSLPSPSQIVRFGDEALEGRTLQL